MESGGDTEIRRGLKAGDKVVVSGQFLIDSEASLRSTIARLEGAGEPQAAPAADAPHRGRGKVNAVDAGTGFVELDHGPIPSMKWGSMTMGFVVENRAQLAGIKRGDAVDFEVRPKPNRDGDFVITRIAPTK
jgi:Cu(I)/Ag(I) efflux system membrane fusion protein